MSTAKANPARPKTARGFIIPLFFYPTRKDFAEITQRPIDEAYLINGASDHSISDAIYLTDPDDNGVELYRDRPHFSDS